MKERFFPFILHYLDPTGEKRKQAVEMDVKCGPLGLFGNVYHRNNAITLVASDKAALVKPDGSGVIFPQWRTSVESANRIISFAAGTCFGKDNVRKLNNNDQDHHLFHNLPKKDEKTLHFHVCKEKAPFEISTKDAECFFNNLEKFQNKINDNTGYSISLIAPKDVDIIIKEHQNYLDQKIKAPLLDKEANELYKKIEDTFIASGQSFFKAFLDTFLDKYLLPYLISNYHFKDRTVSGIANAVKETYIGLITSSLVQVGLDFIIRNALEFLFTKFNINPNYKSTIINQIGVAVAFTNNPFSLLDLGINGAAAASGETIAWGIIRRLPKLKDEEKSKFEPSEPTEDQSEAKLRFR